MCSFFLSFLYRSFELRLVLCFVNGVDDGFQGERGLEFLFQIEIKVSSIGEEEYGSVA